MFEKISTASIFKVNLSAYCVQSVLKQDFEDSVVYKRLNNTKRSNEVLI